MSDAEKLAPRRCVLDTNTVLALWLFEDPSLLRLRAAIDRGALRPLLATPTLAELDHVLAYPRFALAADRRQHLHARYVARCESVAWPDALPVLPLCRDPDDQKFVVLAIVGAAPLLVSRDRALLRLGRHRLLRQRLSILRPETLEAELAASAAPGPDPVS